ncbi:MAG TPA: S9 family peptidase [Longimicrobiales bacterium]|nr:S9 family peptidase [Longimicrobiales bacterium]
MKKTILIALLCATSSAFAQQRPMTARDLWSLGRVGNPVLSPDGRQVAFTVTRYDLDALKSKTTIYTVPITGGEPVALPLAGNSPAWSPDGKQLAYISGGQVYIGDRKVTNLANGAGGPIAWSRDGTKLLVASGVDPEGDSLTARLANIAKGKSQAKIYDELSYRHWDEWEDAQRSHVYVVDVASGQSRDVTPGAFDTPPIALEGFQDYHISPDGGEVAFTRNSTSPTMVGTGNDIYVVSANGGVPQLITQNKANDNSPQYSPDGRYLAYIGMARPGFEADRSEIMLYDRQTKQARSLTGALDLSVDYYAWSPDSKTIYFLAGDQINHSAFKIAIAGGPAVKLTDNTYNSGLAVSADGKTMVVARQSVASPVELFVLDAKGATVRQLTHINDASLTQLALQPAESFWFTGAENARVQGFIVKPPNFNPAQKYPVVFLIHGGPQGVWGNSWSYRWNPNMFTAPGYVVVAVNPRGSTGYGQKFTDEISGDWGGKAFTDLMNGLDYALANNSYMDRTRVAAAGASYGGYMINWINGHTNRFNALINHDGIFNTESMYGSTEELWFPEWEFGGLPWEKPELYRKWTPAASAANMKTPTLVIHGGLDYRVPLEQGLMTFTALRRQNVPARFLYFPDEGHWVLKPANAFVWWETMLGWLAKYIGTPVSTN